MRDQFEDLGQPGRADRVTFAFKASGRVDRRSAAKRRVSLECGQPALPARRKAEVFDLDDLTHGRCIMDFGQIDFARTQRGRGNPANVPFKIVWFAIHRGDEHADAQFDFAGRGAEPTQTGIGAQHRRCRAWAIAKVRSNIVAKTVLASR